MRSFIKIILPTFLVSLGTGGCTSNLIGGGDPSPRYTITPAAFEVPSAAVMDVRLVIADPEAEAVLRTPKIAYSAQPLRYEYLAGAEWTDRLPRLFGIFLERSFENSGAFRAVGTRSELPLGDYTLHTDIRSFHLEQTGSGQNARVIYFARLTDGRNRTIDSRLFETVEPAGQDTILADIEAFNRAADRLGEETVTWVIDAIAAEGL